MSLNLIIQLPNKHLEEPGFSISEDFYFPGWRLEKCALHPSGFLVRLPKEVTGESYGNLCGDFSTNPLWDRVAIRDSNDFWWSSNDIVQYEQQTVYGLPLSFIFSAWAYNEPNAIHSWWISWEYSIGLRFNLSNQGKLLVQKLLSDGSYQNIKVLTLRREETPIQGWFTFWCRTIELDDRYIFLFFSEESPSLIVPKEGLTQNWNPKMTFWTPTRQLFKYASLTEPDGVSYALSPVFTAPYLPTQTQQYFVDGYNATVILMDKYNLAEWTPSAGEEMRVKVLLGTGGWARKFKVSFPATTGETAPTPVDISNKTLYLSLTYSLNLSEEEARIRVKDPDLSLSPQRHLRFGAKWDDTAIFSGYLLEPQAKEVRWGREWELTAQGIAFKLRNAILPAGTAYDGVLHTDAVVDVDICGYAGIDVETATDPNNLKLPQGAPEQGFLWQVEQGTNALDLLERILEFTGWQLIASFSTDENGYPIAKLIYRPEPDPANTGIVAKFWKTTEGANQTPPEGVVYLKMFQFKEITEPPEINEAWVCGQDYMGYPICGFLINADSINNPDSDDYLGFRKQYVEVDASLNTESAIQQRLSVLEKKMHTKKTYEWEAPAPPVVKPGDLVEIEGIEGKIRVDRVEVEWDGKVKLKAWYFGTRL
ncbi:hypothetical protein H5T88_08075 [bacterium]|nr:hypothetical protein [bacterium]